MKCEADQRWTKRAIGFQHFDQIPAHVIEAICSGSDAAPPGGWPAELEIPLRNGGK